VLAVKPDLPAALSGVGAALIAMADYDGAEQWAERLTRAYPGEAHGPVLAARIAAARGDASEALERWQSAAARLPNSKPVLRELCRALLDAARFDEAEAVAQRLLLLDREEGTIQLGGVLARRRPDDDHTAFWQAACAEFPGNAAFMRRRAVAAVRAGRAEDAVAAVNAVLKDGIQWSSDTGLIVGLTHVLASRGDTISLRRSVRDFLKATRGSSFYRHAALRLSRTIFAHFTGAKGPGARSFRERTLRMVERAAMKPKTRNLLVGVVALESSLAGQGTALFDTDVSHSECREFVARVRDSMTRRQSLSFVRINDGEANGFPYEPHLAPHFADDAAEREHVWWGRAVASGERARMTALVADATWQADIIGIPNFGRVLRDVQLAGNDDLSTTRTGRGLRTVLAAAERWKEFRPTALPPPLFTSANLHHDLQRWNLYGELFDGAGDLVLVSCHPDLPDAVRQQFHAGTAANIVIPPRHATIPALVKRVDTPHILPEIIDDVVAEVRRHAAGRMVVVAAGYLGKCILHQSKLAGGVALDVGSAADYWVGLKTRSYQDLA
jgi:hypothetical protein